MSVVDSINNLAVINAAVAQNQAGEDYDEVPVYDLHKVIAQQDIRNEDAVMMLDISPLNFAAGDYNFDGRRRPGRPCRMAGRLWVDHEGRGRWQRERRN